MLINSRSFPAQDHAAFTAHWAKIRREPTNLIKTIVCEGAVASNIGSWVAGEKRLIGYWLARDVELTTSEAVGKDNGVV